MRIVLYEVAAKINDRLNINYTKNYIPRASREIVFEAGNIAEKSSQGKDACLGIIDVMQPRLLKEFLVSYCLFLFSPTLSFSLLNNLI